MCGSYCTYAEVFYHAEKLADKYEIVPIMSDTAAETDSRFGAAAEHIRRLMALSGRKVISTVAEAEPLGPSLPLDALIIAPCTGNTLAKLSHGITDSAVTMAAKAHLRNERPLILAVSTNDGLGLNAKNIGTLSSTRNIYFVPYGQDDPISKTKSLVSDMTQILPTLQSALKGEQLQPMLLRS